jgi:hypothetical protein
MLLLRRPQMTFPTAFNAMLQGIAAFSTFVAAYLALVLSIIVCLVIGELISDRGSLIRVYGVRCVSFDDGASGVRSKAANGDHVKTGQRIWPGT